MHKFVLFCLLPMMCAAEQPLFRQVDLFRQGEAGVHTYRIPALVETSKGTLIAVVDARHDSSADLPAHISLVMRRSRDRGATWSPSQTIREVPQGGVGDPSLLLDRRTGRVWCFHAYGPAGVGFSNSSAGSRTLQIHAIYSDDDGETWSDPVDPTPQLKDPAWKAVFATSGTHIQLKRGRYLVALVVRDANDSVSARNAYSDDGGRTWKVGTSAESGTDESHAVELRDGTILQNFRNGKTRAIARSADGGVTFGPMAHDPALVDPGCNAGFIRYQYQGKDVLIFTNAASTRRENLTVRISHDEGRTWREGRTIHAGPAAYSTVIQLSDGTIAVLYERGEHHEVERITFARLNLKWIRANSRSHPARR